MSGSIYKEKYTRTLSEFSGDVNDYINFHMLNILLIHENLMQWIAPSFEQMTYIKTFLPSLEYARQHPRDTLSYHFVDRVENELFPIESFDCDTGDQPLPAVKYTMKVGPTKKELPEVFQLEITPGEKYTYKFAMSFRLKDTENRNLPLDDFRHEVLHTVFYYTHDGSDVSGTISALGVNNSTIYTHKYHNGVEIGTLTVHEDEDSPFFFVKRKNGLVEEETGKVYNLIVRAERDDEHAFTYQKNYRNGDIVKSCTMQGEDSPVVVFQLKMPGSSIPVMLTHHRLFSVGDKLVQIGYDYRTVPFILSDYDDILSRMNSSEVNFKYNGDNGGVEASWYDNENGKNKITYDIQIRDGEYVVAPMRYWYSP